MRWLGFRWSGEPRYASDYFETALRVRGAPDPQWAGVCRQPDRRGDPAAPRHPHRAGRATARTGAGAWRRTSIFSPACARASSRTARTCCVRGSTWRRRTSTCATRCCTGSAARIITGPATRGASTRCTTSPTRRRTRIEHITHSLCTLEFEDHRPLYDWLIEHLPVPAHAAADRVRAAEPDLHGDEQAQAARSWCRTAT